jgi:outer membrane protein OmpA-like peptidoglycan-associated protein
MKWQTIINPAMAHQVSVRLFNHASASGGNAMKRLATILIHALFSCLLLAAIPAGAADFQGSKDHPLIKRFAGAEIIGYDYKKFDEYKVQTSPYVDDNKTKEPLKSVEGELTRIWYYIPGDNSSAEVYRNYMNDLNAAGFKILWDSTKDEWLSADNRRKWPMSKYFEKNKIPNTLGGMSIWEYASIDIQLIQPANNRKLTAQLSRGGRDTYATLFVMRTEKEEDPKNAKKGVYVALEVVDTGQLKQQMVTVSAGDMSKSISSTGRVALYGIYFDTNKSEVKPESDSALSEIAKLMKAEANLKLHVVGHTDNVGGLASNMDLSKRRAQSVVDALAKKYSIAPARLIANGVAYLAPVASNTNEDGRAKNRRVELVPQ